MRVITTSGYEELDEELRTRWHAMNKAKKIGEPVFYNNTTSVVFPNGSEHRFANEEDAKAYVEKQKEREREIPMSVFNLNKQARSYTPPPPGSRKSKRRIRDRGIKWTEHYHEKSAPMKKRYNKTLGPGSYFRWEGHDYTTNGDYFIVVGPARTKDLKKRFFAGIKRLPEDKKKKVYAPAGEYFSSMHSALSFAADRWAIKFPRGSADYTLNDLMNIEIPRHVRG